MKILKMGPEGYTAEIVTLLCAEGVWSKPDLDDFLDEHLEAMEPVSVDQLLQDYAFNDMKGHLIPSDTVRSILEQRAPWKKLL